MRMRKLLIIITPIWVKIQLGFLRPFMEKFLGIIKNHNGR